jgi:hypothetical protein
MPAYSNFDPHEGTVVSGGTKVTLLRKSRRLSITNDSATKNLKFKFNPQESFGTLKPTETLDVIDLWVSAVYLEGSGVSYRVWSYG